MIRNALPVLALAIISLSLGCGKPDQTAASGPTRKDFWLVAQVEPSQGKIRVTVINRTDKTVFAARPFISYTLTAESSPVPAKSFERSQVFSLDEIAPLKAGGTLSETLDFGDIEWPESFSGTIQLSLVYNDALASSYAKGMDPNRRSSVGYLRSNTLSLSVRDGQIQSSKSPLEGF